MRRLWILMPVLVVVLSIGLAMPAWSAPSSSPPGLKMEAEAAFDGYFKHGEWLPVWLYLENSGPDLDAEAQVRVAGSWGATTYAVPAPLPTGSRKRIPVYVLPNNFSHQLEVQLVAGRDVVLSQKVSVNPRANNHYFLGLVAPERGALSLILGVSLPGERPKEIINLSLGDLPERAEGLRSFDCLVLNDVDTSSLKLEQRAALEAWVRQGGRLVIGGGAGALRTVAGLPDSLLPFIPGGEVEVDTLPGLADFAETEAVRVPGPFVVATHSVPEGHSAPEGHFAEGRTLAAQPDDLPLVRERTVGGGSVNFVVLDLAASPFDAWMGTVPFWEKLLAPGAAYPDWLPPDVSARQIRSSQMTHALSNLPTLDLPSVRGLGLLLILYVVLVGPVNYFLLRWQKRLHWAWGTIPLITLVFSAGAFGLGYTLRGTDLILNKIAVIALQPDGTAGVSSYLGLFSPAQQSYEVEVRGGGLLSPLNPDYNPWGAGVTNTGGEMVFVQGRPGRVRGLTVNQWSMQTFMTEGIWSDFGGVVGDLRIEDEALVGTVRNETPHTLTDVVIVLNNRFVRLGDLSPGEETPVTMDLPDLTSQNFGPSIGWMLFQDELNPGPEGPPREVQLKQSVLDSVFEQGGWLGPMISRAHLSSGGSSRRGLMLIAWLDEAPPDVLVSGRRPTQQTTALLYAPFSYGLSDEGAISLPPGLIPGAMVEMPVAGGHCGPDVASVWLERGEAIFEFQVPEGVGDVGVDELKLVIGADGGGWWQPPDTAVYDWDAGAWAALIDPVMGVNVIPDATHMVSDDGLVRVRLSSESNRGGCLYLELGLEGTR